MKTKVLLLFIFISASARSQDVAFARQTVDTLSAPYFWGRGYTNNGLEKTSKYLVRQLQSFGLKPLNKGSFLQEFTYPVNTFPGKMEISVNNTQLVPGRDFIVSADSKGHKVSGKLTQQDSIHFIDIENKVLVSLENKLTWSVATKPTEYTTIKIDKKALKQKPETYQVNIENLLVPRFKTSNICGVVKGTAQPDSFIVFTAHYDHLGGMGTTTYFPGANDNASGVAMVLSLAKYYAAHPQRYSIAFLFFSGEEAGIIGSNYFTEHPLLPLKKIRFLVNIDLAGTGEEGITVVNASLFPKEFAQLSGINNDQKLFTQLKSRGKAANSDHYWFTEKGVPAFFLYTMGGIKAYHDIYDKAQTLPLSEHEDFFKLLTTFNSQLMRN